MAYSRPPVAKSGRPSAITSVAAHSRRIRSTGRTEPRSSFESTPTRPCPRSTTRVISEFFRAHHSGGTPVSSEPSISSSKLPTAMVEGVPRCRRPGQGAEVTRHPPRPHRVRGPVGGTRQSACVSVRVTCRRAHGGRVELVWLTGTFESPRVSGPRVGALALDGGAFDASELFVHPLSGPARASRGGPPTLAARVTHGVRRTRQLPQP